MIRILLFVFFPGLSICPLSSQGITFFEGTWKDAMAKAKAEDKLLFVDAFAKWCGPCKSMAKNVFTQPKVGDFFNANFINLKLDMEEADGITFGHKYPVQAYPTLFFLDGDGKVVKTIKGAQQPDGLLGLAADAMKKNDKSIAFEARYKGGDRSYDLMYPYVKALNAAGKPSLKISNDYLQSKPDITEEQRLTFLLEAAVEADSKLFDEVISRKKDIIALTGKDVFAEKCKMACENTVKKAIEFEMEVLLTETIEKLKKAVPEEADVCAAKNKMSYYKAFRKADMYRTASQQLIKKSSKDAATLEFIIQDILGHFENDPVLLSDAAEMAADLLDKKEDMASVNLYVKAMILNKKEDKAIRKIEQLREKAEKEKKDVSNYDGLLRYLNSVKS